MAETKDLPASVDINTVDDIDALIAQTSPSNEDGKGGDPNASAPVILEFNGGAGTAPAKEDLEQSVEDPLWKSQVEKHPELAEFKSLDEFIQSRQAPAKPVEQTVNFDLEKELQDYSNVKLDENDSAFATKKTYDVMGNDPNVRQILSEAGLTTVPKTRDEWKAVYDEDKFTYDRLVASFNDAKANIEDQIKVTKKTIALTGVANENAVTGFATDVVDYLYKVNPNIPADLQADIKTRIKTFFSEAEKNPKYYKEKYGVPNFLDKDALKSDFLIQNFDLIPKLTSVPAPSGSTPAPSATSAKEELERLAKGTSMNTLGARGVSSPTGKTVNPFDPKQVAGLSGRELDLAIANLDKELLTT